MMLLSMVHSREVEQGKREGRGDTSQAQNWSNFRNASVDKVSQQRSRVQSIDPIGCCRFGPKLFSVICWIPAYIYDVVASCLAYEIMHEACLAYIYLQRRFLG